MTLVVFTVPGHAVPQPRARTVRVNGITKTYTPAKAVVHQNEIKAAAHEAGVPYIEDGPVRLAVTVVRAYPKSMSKRRRETALPDTRPDLDNYLKAVMDALNGIAWRDDGQVSSIEITKVYGEQPGTVIAVGRMHWEA